jgi:hypothetical protein
MRLLEYEPLAIAFAVSRERFERAAKARTS